MLGVLLFGVYRVGEGCKVGFCRVVTLIFVINAVSVG